MLRPERGGAPEPVGVPAPQVVRDGEPVVPRAVAVLDRAVEDALTGVVADGAGLGGLGPHAQIALVRAEDHPVEIVHGHAIEVAGRGQAIHRRHQIRQRVEPQMRQRDERLDGLELDAQAHRVAQRPVRVGEPAVEVGVLVRQDTVRSSPAPVRMSISRTDSCGNPLRNDVDSIPRPVTAPPRVIVLSCGTTRGARPWGSVAATRSSYVHMPATSAVLRSGSTEMTPVSPEVSSPSPSASARPRNRLEVRLASRTEASGGTAR